MFCKQKPLIGSKCEECGKTILGFEYSFCRHCGAFFDECATRWFEK